MPERFSVSPGRPSPLGVTADDDGINVAVVSRNAERIFVCIFDQSGERELARLLLPGRTDDEIHHGFVAGIKPGAR
jgi:pullulanase/glycogen debranching enzyme